jgi:hypothetical protein
MASNTITPKRVILAFLSFANRKTDGPERRAELMKKGDTIAAVLTILGLLAGRRGDAGRLGP